MTDTDQDAEQEPFLLTVLPFAGLGFLLILAVIWRVLPDSQAASSPAGQNDAELVVAKYNQAPEREILIDPERDFVLGPDDAAVTFVEFSDFECPYCRIASNDVHDVMQRYEGDVRLVFKNFPLDIACNDLLQEPMHRLACASAVLARCAGKQQQELFWETHNALFREPQLNPTTLERIAEDLDISLGTLDACAKDPTTMEEIQQDITLGRGLGVTGTPIFFANGKRVSDYRRYALEAVVEHILSTR